jgi:lysophospholipase L1-like esterase
MLYLPLYNRTESLVLGVPQGSSFEALPPLDRKPIVYYGTSIAHGCSASRPGMAFPAILGRRLDYTVINFAFSGAGRMEEEMADLIQEIDAEVYVLDCLPNMTLDHVHERAEIFIRKLRQYRPNVPIILVEDRTLANAWLLPWWQKNHTNKRAAFRKVYDQLVAEGMTGLSYIEGDLLLGDDGDGTVDGSHPTDLGMVRMADAVEPYLRKALGSIPK